MSKKNENKIFNNCNYSNYDRNLEFFHEEAQSVSRRLRSSMNSRKKKQAPEQQHLNNLGIDGIIVTKGHKKEKSARAKLEKELESRRMIPKNSKYSNLNVNWNKYYNLDYNMNNLNF